MMDPSKQVTESSEFNTLNSFAEGTNSDISETIRHFTNGTRSSAASGDGEDVAESLNVAWNTILAVAGNTEHQKQDKLVDFVKSLQSETIETQSGEVVKSNGGKVWSDLPTFGWQVREAWNYTPKDPRTNETAKARWVNQNAFIARLTSISNISKTDDPLNFTLFALWSLREALEDDAPEETPGEGSLKAASVWILYSAARLWELSVRGEQFEGRLGASGRKYRSQQWGGFAKDRWSVWKEELRKAHENSSGDVRELLKQALAKIESVETS